MKCAACQHEKEKEAGNGSQDWRRIGNLLSKISQR